MADLRLLAYIRVSKVGGRAGDTFHSPDQQRDACAHVVALHPGARIVAEFVDLDRSGGTMERPALDKAMAMLRRGEADGIVVAKLDRFARNANAIAVIEQMEKDGKVFISAADKFDTTTSGGRFALGMMILVAKLVRDQHIENFEDITRRSVGRGVHATVPYGYRRGENGRLEVFEQHAAVVRRIYAERAAGATWAQIADDLNTDGIPAPSASDWQRRKLKKERRAAAAWTRQTVRATVKTRSYLGVAHYGKHELTGAHEALVALDVWEAAQPKGQDTRALRGESLLAGLVRCAGCGYIMGPSSNRGVRRYNCNRHHGGGRCPSPTTAPADRLEEMVAAEFLARYGDVSVQGARRDGKVAVTATALEKTVRELEAYMAAVSVEDVGAEAFALGARSRNAAVLAARDAHDAAVRAVGAAGLVVEGEVWDELTIAERRELLRAGIDHVELRRAPSTRTPLAERFTIRWAGETDDHPFGRGTPGVVASLNGRP